MKVDTLKNKIMVGGGYAVPESGTAIPFTSVKDFAIFSKDGQKYVSFEYTLPEGVLIDLDQGLLRQVGVISNDEGSYTATVALVDDITTQHGDVYELLLPFSVLGVQRGFSLLFVKEVEALSVLAQIATKPIDNRIATMIMRGFFGYVVTDLITTTGDMTSLHKKVYTQPLIRSVDEHIISCHYPKELFTFDIDLSQGIEYDSDILLFHGGELALMMKAGNYDA